MGAKVMNIKRGSIVIANLESISRGSVQTFRRPYIIISNNKANQHSPVITAVAMSTKIWKKKNLPTHCKISSEKVKVLDKEFTMVQSVALCEQIVSLDTKIQIEKVVGHITDKKLLQRITRCVMVQIGAYDKYN